MNFAESRFWLLLLSGLGVIGVLRVMLRPVVGTRQGEFDRCALMVLGLFLLLCVSWLTFLIYVLVAVVSYFGLWWVLRCVPNHRWTALLILVPLQLGPLLYYKYADFLLNGVMALDFPSLNHLAIPVGISFYSFQMVGFVVDTLAFRHPLPRFPDYLNFVGFFPQIVAGPIERRDNLLPQMEAFRFRWRREDINEGTLWIAVGLFFKCGLADNLALYFDATSSSNPFAIWLANLTFGLRIYYDFAGYSLVAVGLGHCFGVRLTLNFLSPYCSTSIVEFWRRWHVTLSQWFRDYVYVPMGGGRSSRWAFNVGVVFVVSGIWHGAGWNFILWGAIHGFALILNRSFGSRVKPLRFPAWVATMLVAFFAWLSFYETRTHLLLEKIRVLFTPQAYTLSGLRAALNHWPAGDQFVLASLFVLAGAVLIAEWQSVARKDEPYWYLRRPWVAALLVVLAVLMAPGSQNAFIYFAF